MSRGKSSNKKKVIRYWSYCLNYLLNLPSCPNCGIHDEWAHFFPRSLQDYIDRTPIEYFCQRKDPIYCDSATKDSESKVSQ